jgi:DNA-binding CsgD family transcriptional regulator
MPPSPADRDRAAIVALIAAETEAYRRRDYEAWARCWTQAPHAGRWIFHSAQGLVIMEGWAENSGRIRALMTSHPVPETTEVRHESVNVHVGTDVAWATFEQHVSGAGVPLMDLAAISSEMRILERTADGWKIAFVANFHRTFEYATAAMLRVDGEGRVAWRNAAGESALAATPGLVVRAGKLRAVDRDADRRLQAAIRWAGELDRGVWPRRGSVPVVLGLARGEPADICWVVARDGRILVALNDRPLTEERLAAAASIYGLTPAQLRLAGLIVDGRSLVEAARDLRVSLNTARTQLRRMFEKTGVRSQAALVVALLAAAMPVG